MLVGLLALDKAGIDDVPEPAVPKRNHGDRPAPRRARTVAFNEKDISDKPPWLRERD